MTTTADIDIATFAARVKAAFIKKANEAFDQNAAELLTQEIVGDLNKAKTSALKALLGLEQRYDGQMEFDHCNGRQGALDKMLTDIAQPVLKEWVRESFDEFRNSPAFATARTAAKKAIIRQIKEQLSYSGDVYDTANQIAHELRKQATDEIRKELGIGDTTRD